MRLEGCCPKIEKQTGYDTAAAGRRAGCRCAVPEAGKPVRVCHDLLRCLLGPLRAKTAVKSRLSVRRGTIVLSWRGYLLLYFSDACDAMICEVDRGWRAIKPPSVGLIALATAGDGQRAVAGLVAICARF